MISVIYVSMGYLVMMWQPLLLEIMALYGQNYVDIAIYVHFSCVGLRAQRNIKKCFSLFDVEELACTVLCVQMSPVINILSLLMVLFEYKYNFINVYQHYIFLAGLVADCNCFIHSGEFTPVVPNLWVRLIIRVTR